MRICILIEQYLMLLKIVPTGDDTGKTSYDNSCKKPEVSSMWQMLLSAELALPYLSGKCPAQCYNPLRGHLKRIWSRHMFEDLTNGHCKDARGRHRGNYGLSFRL